MYITVYLLREIENLCGQTTLLLASFLKRHPRPANFDVAKNYRLSIWPSTRILIVQWNSNVRLRCLSLHICSSFLIWRPLFTPFTVLLWLPSSLNLWIRLYWNFKTNRSLHSKGFHEFHWLKRELINAVFVSKGIPCQCLTNCGLSSTHQEERESGRANCDENEISFVLDRTRLEGETTTGHSILL